MSERQAGRKWRFTTWGKPRPKGSMKCMGAGGGRGRHVMQEDNPESKPWKLAMIRDIRAAYGITPIRKGRLVAGYTPEPYKEAVHVEVTFAFERNRGVDGEVWPSHETMWPIADDIGDTDKLCRNLGDALEQSGLIANDRQIVLWSAAKLWTLPGEKAHVEVSVVAL